MDAVLEVLAVTTTGRKYAVMLRIRKQEKMHPSQNSSSVLIRARALLLLQFPGGRYTSPSSPLPWGWEHAPCTTLLGKQWPQKLSNSTQPSSAEFTIMEYSSFRYCEVVGLMLHHILLKNSKSFKNLFNKSCINHISHILLLLLTLQCFQ